MFCVLEAVCLMWLIGGVVVDELSGILSRGRWVNVFACWWSLVARWGPLSRVIADCAVYVKFVGLVSVALFMLGRLWCSCCAVDTGEVSHCIKDGGATKRLLWL